MRPRWARPWVAPAPHTLLRVYRGFRGDNGVVRYVINRDPANGDVSPLDLRWPRMAYGDRDPNVGDVVAVAGHEDRTVTIIEREWRDGILHLTATSISIHHPERP